MVDVDDVNDDAAEKLILEETVNLVCRGEEYRVTHIFNNGNSHLKLWALSSDPFLFDVFVHEVERITNSYAPNNSLRHTMYACEAIIPLAHPPNAEEYERWQEQYEYLQRM